MVFQSLALAQEEMHTITHDTWEAEVWENADCPLVLYFAKKVSYHALQLFPPPFISVTDERRTAGWRTILEMEY
jgi:hypothetical protein